MNFLEIFKSYRKDIIKHTIELVSFKSVCVENEVVDGVTYRFGIEKSFLTNFSHQAKEKFGIKTF